MRRNTLKRDADNGAVVMAKLCASFLLYSVLLMLPLMFSRLNAFVVVVVIGGGGGQRETWLSVAVVPRTRRQ